MALSGTINGTTANEYISSKITWSATQSVNGNYSDVTATLSYSRTNTGYETYGRWNGSITINGTTTSSAQYITIKYNSNTVAISATERVYHDSDGSKKITISASGYISGTSLSSTTISSSVTLTTIPRASTITSASNITLGNKCSIKWTPASTSFKYKIKFSLGDWNYTTGFISPSTTSAYTYDDYTISGTTTANSTTIYAELPKATSGKMTATLTTYNSSGTKIGSSSQKTFTVSIPSSVKPSIGTMTLDPVNITTVDGTSRNILVQGKNELKISVSGCAAGTGSTIKSYTFSGPDISSTVTSSDTSASVSGIISTAGTSLTYTVKVTDNRGRTATSTTTITCLFCGSPSFSSFITYRCDSDGNAKNDGTNIKYSLSVNYSSVNDTNKSTVQIYYKKSTSSSWTEAANAITSDTITSISGIIKDSSGTNITFDANSTYLVYATITDNYSGSANSETSTVFGSPRVFNVRSNGTGMAFGKMAETDNLLESKWPVKFDDTCAINGDLTVGVSTQSSTPTNGIRIHDVRDADITPDSFGDKNVNFYFDQVLGRWSSIMHMKGWTGSYAAWELAGNANTSLFDTSLKYRQGVGDTWGDWQTVLTSENINSYADVSNYLPLNGGTLTGMLKLPSNLYYADSTAGVDCQNSDIVGVNAMYFNDASDSAGEAINFYRSDGCWDTLYAKSGVLKFHPNRATSTALGGYTIYNSSNFRRGTCTLSSSTDTTVTFSSALGGTPTVLLTPLTDTAGVIPGKVKSTSSTGFTAIIGGSAVSSAKFAYLAIYY